MDLKRGYKENSNRLGKELKGNDSNQHHLGYTMIKILT